MFNIMPKLQGIVVDIILANLEILNNLSILHSVYKWIGASNDDTKHKKDIINFRSDGSSSGTVRISSKAVKNRYICQEEMNHNE